MKFLPSHNTGSPALMVTSFAVQKIWPDTR